MNIDITINIGMIEFMILSEIFQNKIQSKPTPDIKTIYDAWSTVLEAHKMMRTLGAGKLLDDLEEI